MNRSTMLSAIAAVGLATSAFLMLRATDNTAIYGKANKLSALINPGETPEQAYNRIKTENACVIVKFYAEWCGPCKALEPVFKSYSALYKNTLFLEVDVELYGPLSNQLGIQSMPTFIIYRKGQQCSRWSKVPKGQTASQKLHAEIASNCL